MINDLMNNFDWYSRALPMSRPIDAYSSIAVYLLGICLLRTVLQRPVTVPTSIAATHNLILCLGSLLMFVGASHESIKVMLSPRYTHIIVNEHLATVGSPSLPDPLCLLLRACLAAVQVTLDKGSAVWLFCLPKGTPIKARASDH